MVIKDGKMIWLLVVPIGLYLLFWGLVVLGTLNHHTLAEPIRTAKGTRTMPVVYDHWLPQALHVSGITLFRFCLLPEKLVVRTDGKINTADITIAHEAVHFIENGDRGDVAWLLQNLYYGVRYRNKGARPPERRAQIQAPLLVAGTHPGLEMDLRKYAHGTVVAP